MPKNRKKKKKKLSCSMLTWNKFLVYGFSSHISLFYIIGNKLLSCLNKMVIR
jgi:hypothetical protein